MPVLSDKAGARATSRRISLVLGPIEVAVRTSAGTEPVGPRQRSCTPFQIITERLRDFIDPNTCWYRDDQLDFGRAMAP